MENILVMMRLNKKPLFFAILLATIIMICITLRSFPTESEIRNHEDIPLWRAFPDSQRNPHEVLHSRLMPEKFDGELKVPRDWYKKNCYGELETLDDLGKALEQWKKSENHECREMFILFTDMYLVSERNAPIVISEAFSLKVLHWLNNKQELLEEAKKQTIYTISNKYSQEGTVFNPLRAKRPGASGGKQQEFVDNMINESKQSCDFCKYKLNTAKDIFGTIETEHAASFSNTFKIEKFHGLVIMKHHDPLHFTLQDFLEMFKVAQQWFNKAHDLSKRYTYPHIYWDILPKASASQIHPHFHVCLSADGYYAKWNHIHAASLEFAQVHQNQNYFTALTQIHHALGLAIQFGNATAFPYLTPQGGHEIVILSRTVNEDLFMMLYFVMKALMDSKLYALSAGIVFPPMDSKVSNAGREMPAMIRILQRGPADTQRSDISSIELFGTPNVNVDPFTVRQLIVESINKRRNDVLR